MDTNDRPWVAEPGLYNLYAEADAAFQFALHKAYGRHAGDQRYVRDLASHPAPVREAGAEMHRRAAAFFQACGNPGLAEAHRERAAEFAPMPPASPAKDGSA